MYKKSIHLVFALCILVVACNQREPGSTKNETTTLFDNQVAEELRFLVDFEGRYSREIHLFDHPVLATRLSKMLGEQFAFLKSIWETETPIENNKGMLYAWGMRDNSGGDPEAIFMADLKKNKLYIGIKKNGDQKIYSEDGGPAPQRLLDWASE